MKKKIEEPESKNISYIIGQILHDRTCIVNGCSPKWHVSDAEAIILELKRLKYLNGDVS